MSSESSPSANHLDITLLGKEYRVACPPEEQEALRAAVDYVDEKMHEIAEKTKSNIAERIAVMAALNITHELLHKQQQLTSEAAAHRHQVRDLFERVEHALAADPNSHEA